MKFKYEFLAEKKQWGNKQAMKIPVFLYMSPGRLVKSFCRFRGHNFLQSQ